jgi:photosystem II stability/assembly factor-like uncharacterized protein
MSGTGGSGGTRWMSAVGEGGVFVKTFDGVSWQRSQPTTTDLFGVSCIGNVTGWAVGAGGAVLHTADGGDTWMVQQSGTTQALRGVRFADDQVGWAVGDGGTIVFTRDGGAHWQAQASGTSATLHAVAVMGDELHAWAAGDHGILLATADGGQTWTPMATGTSANLYGVAADPALGHGFVVGEAGTLLELEPGGVVARSAPTTVTLRAVAVPDTQDGVFAALAAGDAGTVLVLAHGASAWQPLASGTSATLRAALCEPETALAAGDGGTLLQTRSPQSGGLQVIDSHTSSTLFGLEDL